jgi:hypothetical protein
VILVGTMCPGKEAHGLFDNIDRTSLPSDGCDLLIALTATNIGQQSNEAVEQVNTIFPNKIARLVIILTFPLPHRADVTNSACKHES